MKLLVLSHPLSDFYFTPHRMSWLGVHSLIDRLVQLDISCEFIDLCPPDAPVSDLEIPSWLSYLKPYLIAGEKGPFSFFSSYKSKSFPLENLRQKINDFKPDAILISSFAFAYADCVLDLAKFIKSYYPCLPIIAGGHGPSCNPEFFLSSGFIDQVLCGPAEGLEKLDLTRTGKQNLHPDSTLTVLATLAITKKNASRFTISGSFSRGCPYQCQFCANYLTHGRRFLTAPLKEIEEKVNILPSSDSCHLNFEDDNLLLNTDFFFSLIDIFKKKSLQFTFSFENGIDYRLLDDDLLQRLVENGLTGLNLTLATTSSSISGRKTDLIRFVRVCTHAQTLKIKTIAYIIAGLPGTTVEDLTSDMIFLSTLPITIGLSPFYPVPGMPDFKQTQNEASFQPGLFRSSSLYPWTTGFTVSDLATAFRLSRTLNALKSPNDSRQTELMDRIIDEKKLFTLASDRMVSPSDLNQRMIQAVLESIPHA